MARRKLGCKTLGTHVMLSQPMHVQDIVQRVKLVVKEA